MKTKKLLEIFAIETKKVTPVDGFKSLCNFVEKYQKSYPSLKSFSNERNIAYFSYLNYPASIQRMIYSTNWIECLTEIKEVFENERSNTKSRISIVFDGYRCNGEGI